jgi:hypothetical protein
LPDDILMSFYAGDPEQLRSHSTYLVDLPREDMKIKLSLRTFPPSSGLPSSGSIVAAVAADLGPAAADADAEFHSLVPTPQPATQDRESQERFVQARSFLERA